ncbi:MAG: 1-deoxy-D-xylulose-5-phosphate synthase [Deltaproteobacteria bacterium]|nr:1-deoxy-D-xylulose-5-phosphate synthase [Candidatus Zymogenaceae bacterium]
MKNILDTINGPEDLKSLSIEEMELLAAEIRELIIDTVSKTGGHLASSLGTVELTIALYHVFQPPKDLIIWDVGHQAYTHKILTGRKDCFGTLRCLDGISGFPKRSECPEDVFGTGHSSTSISAALGISTAWDIQKKPEDSRALAVIGDGSLTGGQAFEALNQAGHLVKDVIVIVNDNEMSISPNVGALSSFLSRKLSTRPVMNLKKEIVHLLKSVPGIGEDIYKVAKRAEDAIKGFLMPGMLFEAMNFQYFGPIDGHRIDRLIETLTNIKDIEGPILLHVLTKKGKGYLPAEENPSRYHGVGVFDVETGSPIGPKNDIPTYTKVFSDVIVELAKKHDSIVAITAAMAEGTGLTTFSGRFPDRFFDVGIAEQHAVTFAAGLATQGLIPIVAVYSTFLQRAYDQILHDVALQDLPVIFAIDRGGIVGEDGPTHHGLFDMSYLRNIPNLIIMAPRDENEFARMLVTAVECKKPIAVRYPRGKALGVAVDDDPQPIPIGTSETLIEGNDLTIVAIGSMVEPAMDAARRLLTRKITATVIDARFVKPLDIRAISASVQKTGALLTIEEGILSGGFSSAILEGLAADSALPRSIKRLGIGDRFVEHGPQSVLRDRYDLSSRGIFQAALDLLGTREKAPTDIDETVHGTR